MNLDKFIPLFTKFFKDFNAQMDKFNTHTNIVDMIVEFSKLNDKIVNPTDYTFEYMQNFSLDTFDNIKEIGEEPDEDDKTEYFSSGFPAQIVNFVEIYNIYDKLSSSNEQIEKYFVTLYEEITKYIQNSILSNITKIIIFKKYKCNELHKSKYYDSSSNFELNYSKYTIEFVIEEFKLENPEFYECVKKLKKNLPIFYDEIKNFELKKFELKKKEVNVYMYKNVYQNDFKSCVVAEINRVNSQF